MSLLTDKESIVELARQLANTEVDSDVPRARKLLRNVLKLVQSGADTQSLFPQVIKHVASSDVLSKKLACWFIQKHGENSDMLLLAVNSLVKDCEDPSPMTRGLALRTLISLPQPGLLDYMVQPTLKALTDSSAYVRRIAVVACIKLCHLDQDLVYDYSVADKLYSMIRDSDPIVVVSCLSALDEILAEEGGIVINRNIAHYLHNKLGMFTEWGLVTVLSTLKRYQPQTEDETLDIMNVIDSYLKYSNASVVIATMEYFLHLVQDMPHLETEVYKRSHTQIIHFLGCGNPELVYVLLEYISSLLLENKNLFQTHHRSFFCKYNEPTHLKTKRLQLLPSVASQDNFQEILEELGMHCTDVTAEVAASAISSVAKLADEFPDHFQECIRKLIELLQLNVDHVTSSILGVMQNLDLKQHDCAQQVISQVLTHISTVSSLQGKKAILWLLGEYSEMLEDTPYILEEYINSAAETEEAETSDLSFQLMLLSTTVKLFLKRPAECQDMLSAVLEQCLTSNSLDLRERASFYFTLLKTDVNQAKIVICGS